MSEGKLYSDSDLLSMIQIALNDQSKYSIILTSRDEVTYQRFLSVMNFLKVNEINNLKIGIKKNEDKN